MKKDIKFILFPLIALIIFGLGMYFLNQKKPAEVSNVEAAPQLSVLREGAPSLGSPSAKITLVEFFDPECEACSAFHPILKDILNDFAPDIYFVARYMLYHGNSQEAANALEAARVQGKFWELQDILFVRQSEWSHKKESVMPIFEKYAEELKLDLNKFKLDVNDTNLKANIAKDVAEGNAIGVRGTPSFFINGRPMTNLSDSGLREAIVEELKKVK